MGLPRPSSLWTRLDFPVKFALVIAFAGLLMAVVPLTLAGGENRSEATQRAADKAAIAVNLVSAQRASLAAFARGMAQDLAVPLAAHDVSALASTLRRYSVVNTPADIVGVHGSLADLAVRAGTELTGVDAPPGVLATTSAPAGTIVAASGGTPWLLASSRVAGTDESTFIARPLGAAFVAWLDAFLATGADRAAVAIVRGHTVASPGSAVLDTHLDPGASLNGPVAAFLAQHVSAAAASVIDVGGRQAGADLDPLGGGFTVLVTTPVSALGTLWLPVAILIGLIAMAMLLIVLVVQTDLQRPLRRLDRAVAALARDRYDVPVPRSSNGEIGRLAASFEHMRRQLHATMTATSARALIASELTSAQPLVAALGTVCAQLSVAAGADAGFIVVGGTDTTEAFIVGDAVAAGTDVDRLLGGDGPIGVAHRHPGAEAVISGPAGAAEAGVLRHVCAAPLRMGTSVLGVIGVGRDEGSFSGGDAALVSTSAEQVALALERHRIVALMQRQATVDDLTGLYNHRFLIDHLGRQVALAERLGAPLAVLVIDLDHFKRVNDTHGHPVGDTVLSAFARTLSRSIRRADLAARYGGEEFVVVMSNTGTREALLVAEKIRAAAVAMVVPIEGSSATVSLSVSVGGAAYPEDTSSAAQLLATADAALYDAKHAGRNRVCMAGAISVREDSRHVTGVAGADRPAQ